MNLHKAVVIKKSGCLQRGIAGFTPDNPPKG